MARRVIFDGSGSTGSPLKIGVAGADAAIAQFNACIFDGNQPPLRLWGAGFSANLGITFNQHNGGQNVAEGTAIPVVVTPPGTTPVFMTMWRWDDGLNRLRTPSSSSTGNTGAGGGGGGICSNRFAPLCYSVGPPGAPNSPPPNTLINYCVFKNAN
jgi:hypothetical protein